MEFQYFMTINHQLIKHHLCILKKSYQLICYIYILFRFFLSKMLIFINFNYFNNGYFRMLIQSNLNFYITLIIRNC